MIMQRQKALLSLILCVVLVCGLWIPTTAGEPLPQVYNQDGFGFSGPFPSGSEPLGENVEMIGHDNWPDGFTKSTTATFGGGVFDGQYIWMIPDRADRVIRIDKDTGEMTGFNSWPDGFNDNAVNKFVGGVYDGHSVWMIPSSANMVVKINSDGTMIGYNSWPDGIDPTTVGKFKGGTFDGDSIWMVPSNNFEKLVKINTSSGTMTVSEGWPSGFDSGGLNKFGGAVFDGTYIWMIPANADRVIKVHKDTGVMTGYSGWPEDLTRHGYGNFQGGFYDGEYVYMQPSEASVMVKVDANGVMSTVAGSGKNYNGGAFDGANIWMAPTSASFLKKYNIGTATFQSYSNWPDGFSKGTFGFVGGVFDGESVWMIPNTANMVLQIKTVVPAPDLTVSIHPKGTFKTGQAGAAYTVAVANLGTLGTSGVVTVTHTVPSGLTATGISGDGWDCDLAALTCSRGDVLAVGNRYPAITVTVDVDEQAATAVTLDAAVEGGGESNTGNNSGQYTAYILRTYLISVSQTETLVFPAQTAGYAPIEEQVVTITRTGTGDIHNLAVNIDESPSSFTVSGPALTSVTEAVYTTTFTISPNHGLPAGTYDNMVVVTGDNGAYANFGVSFTVNNPISEPEPDSSPISSSNPREEVIKVRVEDTDALAGTVVVEVGIRRTTHNDGSKKDDVVFGVEQAKLMAESMKTAGSTSASIVIPDDKDEVSEVNVTVPKEAGKLIADAKIELGISTKNVKVNIPSSSLEGFADDLYFNFIPIKKEEEKRQVKERAEQETVVKIVAGDKEVSIVGRPMTIETNMQSRPVTLTMPLGDVNLSDEQLANLGIYIEHSDGTKELLRGVLVPFDDSGAMGLQFTVNKFSTFTLVHIDGLAPVAGTTDNHTAYMKGYEDGTFRPEKSITRAEMAAVLARTIDLPAIRPSIAYSDVSAQHWAKDAIARVTEMGLMQGYKDGTFGAEKPITRAEMATLAAALHGDSSSVRSGAGFTDTKGHWAEANIAQVQGAGLISGYEDGAFRPDESLTRAQAVTIMNRLLDRGPAAAFVKLPWKDVSSDYWAAEAIAEASINHAYRIDAEGQEEWAE